jgi:arabinosaccharide transport system substrate-binding protein
MPDLKGKIYVRPMPIWEPGNKRSAGMGGTGTSVTKQSKYKDLAMDFLAYAKLTRESNIKLWTILLSSQRWMYGCLGIAWQIVFWKRVVFKVF